MVSVHKKKKRKGAKIGRPTALATAARGTPTLFSYFTKTDASTTEPPTDGTFDWGKPPLGTAPLTSCVATSLHQCCMV